MEAKSTIKVGVVVLLALAVFGGLYIYLSHLNTHTYTLRVAFSDTHGLGKQATVHMDGVGIGEVKDVILDTKKIPIKPIIVLAIDDKYDIPMDSKFTVTSGLLISNAGMEVIPGKGGPFPHNYTQIVQGEPPAGGLAQVSPELASTIKKLDSTFDNLNSQFKTSAKKINRILDQTQTLLATTNRAARSAQDLVGNPRLKDSLLASATNFKKVTEDARVTADHVGHDLRDLVASGKGKFDKLSDNLLDLLTKVGNTVDDANTVIAKVTQEVNDPRLQESLRETVEQLRTTLARINQIASNLDQLTGDPQVQNDLKVSASNLRAATENGAQVAEKFNNFLGGVVGPSGNVRKPHLPTVSFIGNVSEQINPWRLRVDADARVGIGGRNLFDFGFYDLGQDTRLNVQVGTQLNDSTLFRYGLYASKLGVGLEWQALPSVSFRGDLWDTVHPRLDARAIFRVDKDASIWVGTDGLFRQPVPLVGVQFNR